MVVLGASYDTPSENRAWRDDMGFGFRLLSDADRTAAAAYGVVRPPADRFAAYPARATFVVDPAGLVSLVYVVAGSQIAGHAARVLDDLRVLKRG